MAAPSRRRWFVMKPTGGPFDERSKGPARSQIRGREGPRATTRTYYGARTADRNAESLTIIEVICAEFEAYGYRRVTAELRHKGHLVNSKKVRRLMRERGLSPKQRRRYVATTDSDHDEPIFPNLAVLFSLRGVIARAGRFSAEGGESRCRTGVRPCRLTASCCAFDRVLGVLILDGDFFVPTHRSEWDPETLLEGPFDPERAVRRFEEANAIFASGQGRQIRYPIVCSWPIVLQNSP
jgi:hypothetical protein